MQVDTHTHTHTHTPLPLDAARKRAEAVRTWLASDMAGGRPRAGDCPAIEAVRLELDRSTQRPRLLINDYQACCQ